MLKTNKPADKFFEVKKAIRDNIESITNLLFNSCYGLIIDRDIKTVITKNDVKNWVLDSLNTKSCFDWSKLNSHKKEPFLSLYIKAVDLLANIYKQDFFNAIESIEFEEVLSFETRQKYY